MTESKKLTSRWKRWFKRLTVCFLIGVVVLVVYTKDYMRTLASLQRVPGTNAYVMDYYADYHLDEISNRGMDVQNIEDSFLETLFPDVVLPIATRVKRRFVPKSIDIIEEEGHHCSSVFLSSNDGAFYFARNQDYKNDAYLILRVHDSKGIASVSVIDLAYLNMNRDDLDSTNWVTRIPLLFAPYYAFDGMNRHGVAVGVFSIDEAEPPQTPGRPDIISSTLMRVILDNAQTAQEAIDITRHFNVHFVEDPVHFMVADSEGDSRVVEYIGGEIRETIVNGPWQVCTNKQVWGRAETEIDASCRRYKKGSAMAEKLGGNISDDDAFSTVRSMSVEGWTMWTSTYNLSTGDFSVTYKSAVDNRFEGHLPR